MTARNLATQMLGKQNQDLMCQGGEAQKMSAFWWLLPRAGLPGLSQTIPFPIRCALDGEHKCFQALSTTNGNLCFYNIVLKG